MGCHLLSDFALMKSQLALVTFDQSTRYDLHPRFRTGVNLVESISKIGDPGPFLPIAEAHQAWRFPFGPKIEPEN